MAYIEKKLGIFIKPDDVRLKPGVQDPYRWTALPEKRYLFQKHLSKLGIREKLWAAVKHKATPKTSSQASDEGATTSTRSKKEVDPDFPEDDEDDTKSKRKSLNCFHVCSAS